jgi:Tfp pilus assembly protein PilF
MKKIKKTFLVIFVLLTSWFISSAQNEKIPVTSSSEKAVQLYQKAWTEMENAEIAKAHQLLEDALKEDPEFFMGHFMLAFNNLYFGNLDVFKAHAEKALNSKAALSKGEMLLKTALRRMNKNPKADVTDVGENLVKIYPSDEVAYFMLASFQGVVNDLKGSAETYKKLLEIAKNKGPVYNMLGYTYLRMNDYPSAKKAFDKYIELVPDHPNPYDSKGDYFMAVKDYENAYNSFMKAYELDNAWSHQKAMKAKELMEKEMVTDGEIPFTSEEILEKCIQHHDPTGVWNTYKGKMHHVTVLGQNYVVTETIEFDKPNDYYISTAYQNFGILKRGMNKGHHFFSLDDDTNVSQQIKDNWGLSSTGINRYKNQHLGHFGMPMMLKTAGMTVAKKAETVKFDGRDCYALTFTGVQEKVIDPIFEITSILYIDPSSFCLRGYNWIIDENTKFTAVLSGEIAINGLKIPHIICLYNAKGEHGSSSINTVIPGN